MEVCKYFSLKYFVTLSEKMRLFFYSVLLLLCVSKVFATHNRGGEITYKYIGNPLSTNPYEKYKYLFTITVYMNDGSNIADRCYDTLYFGDGTSAVVPRNNGPKGICSCGDIPCGQLICAGYKVNTYTVTHSYGAPGLYLVRMYDPMRNNGVLNIPNSGNQVFYIETLLNISDVFNQSYINNSPQFKIVPRDFACIGKCWIFNAGAYDPDGDSLSYELTECRGIDYNTGQIGVAIPGYAYPNEIGNAGSFTMNSANGTITWCSPTLQGEYNFAFKIYEWRNINGEWKKLGYVLRDMQIVVGVCNNNAPVFQSISDTCIVADNVPATISKTIVVTDPDGGSLELEAVGSPFAAPSPTANFSATPSTATITGYFSWTIECQHIRKDPYLVILRASDKNSTSDCFSQNTLSTYTVFSIRVLAPPPKNLTGMPVGTSIILNWNHSNCASNTHNPVIEYHIYRKDSCDNRTPSYCENGIPSYWGYSYIGKTLYPITTFTDNNNGAGLVHGINYSYLVVALHKDGSVSMASNSVCQKLKYDTPILLNVDVQSTSVSTGNMYVRWMNPIAGSNGVDTILYPSPYALKVYERIYPGGTYSLINTMNYPYFAAMPSTLSINSTTLNTQINQYQYKVEFYSNNTLFTSSRPATSVFLKAIPNDRKIELQWNCTVPWMNYKHSIYRKDPSTSFFNLIGTTNNYYFKDSMLVNNQTYCYKVQTEGAYTDPFILKPLLNFSQELCAMPLDKTSPCVPSLNIKSNCDIGKLELKWNKPRQKCNDDVIKYYLYYKPTEDNNYTLMDSIFNLNDTVYTFDNPASIAGCFAIVFVDSSGNKSPIQTSNTVCTDNCPEFELPNVVTFNNDGVNDFFMAIKVKYIKSIDLKIYNRWGQLLYETTDPYFKWDGTVKQTNQRCSDGTYFYTCIVNEIRLKGIVPKKLKGYFQVFH
ncbi:MAG: gliding motility-associated C-terminal domain-containing protein [Bacteroidia bacterium]|nr:gliding motility-associated C-terminal domain-containing protein [Bacteroidia bacterium]